MCIQGGGDGLILGIEGVENDYVDFEAFWKTIKAKHVKEGMQIGWFVWKVDQSSNNNNAWSDYLIFNIFANEAQMKEMNSKPPEWWQNEIKTAHKGKTKRSIIKKYTQELILPYLFHGFYNFLGWSESMWVILALFFYSLYLHRDLKNKQKMKKREKEIKKI